MTDQQMVTLVWFATLTFLPACSFAIGFLLGWVVGKGNNNSKLR